MNPLVVKALEKVGILLISTVLGVVASGGAAFGPLGPLLAASAAILLQVLNKRFGPAAMLARLQPPR